MYKQSKLQQVGHFRASLSRALVLTARKWSGFLAEQEADRLTPLVESLAHRSSLILPGV